MKMKKRSQAFARLIAGAKEQHIYPYFKPISQSWGPEVIVDGRKLIMAGSNDYLGLAHDPRVVEAAIAAIHRWGAGPGGSRFLSGNMSLHEDLEERLARFVNKKKAVVHTTGFLTNLGVLGSLISPSDIILCDREDHASIFEGCRSSGARIISFAHNDRLSAKHKIEFSLKKAPDAHVFLITEGVFSMSGDCADLTEMVKIKDDFPNLTFYLDDAHGLGVMGCGKGSAAQADYEHGMMRRVISKQVGAGKSAAVPANGSGNTTPSDDAQAGANEGMDLESKN
jgi:7-keto-8-aminopelargonate synthetase-like enzyme